jgi:hypothetical protein
MFIFSLWTTNANLDIVPTWNLDNYAQFFETARTSAHWPRPSPWARR